MKSPHDEIRRSPSLLGSGSHGPQADRDRQLGRSRAGRPNLHRTDQRADAVRAQGDAGGVQAGLDLAITRGWLTIDRSGTFVKFTQAGADLFA
jgi:hypothetical protein